VTNEPLLEVGRTGRAHGVRGELYLILLTDRLERVAPGSLLQVGHKWCTVESSRPAGDRWLVRLCGIEDRNAAEQLAGQLVRAERLPDKGEGLYVDELIGADVVGVDGASHGKCVAILANPAHALLELESGALVPVVFVVSVTQGQVKIDPPEGLLNNPE